MSEKNKQHIPTSNIARAITLHNSFALDRGGRMHFYSKGVYIPEGEDFVKKGCLAFLEEEDRSNEWTSRKGREVLEWIRLKSGQLLETPRSDVLNVQNGLVNLATGKLQAHTPYYLSKVQIPVSFDPKAECPEWDAFIHQVLPGCEDLFWEIVGYVLVPDSQAQKILLLYGPGGNGKSTLLRALESLLGRENVSNKTLEDLASNRFASADLYGKLANICGEVPAAPIKDSGQLKQLTGGDEISAEFKFKNPFKFRNFAKLIFSANELPKFNDSSDGLWDRLLIVPMEKRLRFSESERSQSEILAALAQPDELSGALNKALEGRKRLNTNKRFSEPERSKQLLSDLRGASDPVEEFLRAETLPSGEVETARLRDTYNQWARVDGLPELDRAQLGKALKRLRPNVKRGRRGPQSDQTSVYQGISLAPIDSGSKGSKANSTT